MFDPQITHAREFISRLERCQREGFKAIPASVPVSEEEYHSWYLGIERLIGSAFGEESKQLEQWRQQKLRLGDMIEKSIRESAGSSSIPGYVNYYNACIAFLRELETTLVIAENQRKINGTSSSVADLPPDSFTKAVFAVLWPSQRIARIAFVVIALSGIGMFSLWTSLPEVGKSAVITWIRGEKSGELSFGSPIPFQTGWIFIGYRDQGGQVFVEGPTAWVAFRPTGGERGAIVPSVGDVLRIRKDRHVVVANYRIAGLKHQLTSPPLVKDPLTSEDDTGVQLSVGMFVIVRDVETSGYPGRASSIWARIASCDEQTDACKRARDESK